MMKEKRIGSVVAAMLMSTMLLSACGKITLPTLLVLDPAASNTLTIQLPASLGGGTVTSNLVGNVNTTITVDTNKLISSQGAPGTVRVDSLLTAGSSITVGGMPSGTLCTSIPKGDEAGGIAYLSPLIQRTATFQLTIPTETKSVKNLFPPILLILKIDDMVPLDLRGFLNLLLKGTGLSMHAVGTTTIPASIPLLGGSAVTLDTTLKSTQTPVTGPLLDECQNASKCGNGVVDPGETCDIEIPVGQPGACPTSCDDGDVCTTDTLQDASTCQAQCTNTPIIPLPCMGYEGTWFTRITTTGTITAPSPVGTLNNANIDLVLRIVLTQTCDRYNERLEICSLSTTATGGIPFSIDYSEAVLASMNATGSVPYACYKVGDTVTLPNFTINSGWDGLVPPNPCPVPGADGFPVIACPGAIDSDGDGIYGITLTIHLFGALNLTVYAGLTMNISMANMVLTDANTINGTTSFPINGYIFSSTSGATGVLNVVPVSNAVPITLIQLPGDVPCATVLTHCTGATCIP